MRLTLLIFVALIAGCGGGRAVVSGNVTLDGEPLVTGTVTWISTDGKTVAYGQIQNDGSYRAEMPAGEYFVTVVATSMPEQNENPMIEAVGKLLVPAKYTRKEESGLKYTVQSGNNQIDIPLTTSPE
ncbi:MAG: hypothetical protein KatS3mg105_4231 [Gemmatales bacterium]|nr:MAG: hypothetical protein KatS3mg105_4231 [Gemmatales bacterium]